MRRICIANCLRASCHSAVVSGTQKGMRVYVDFDDVLCETAQGLAVLALEMFGRQVPFEKIHAFDLRVAFDLHLEQYLALMERAHEPDFLRAVKGTR